MFRGVTPISILRNHASTLVNTLPQLRDGDVEAVHDARVASRRVRQVLPLTEQWHRPSVIDDLTGKFRDIGRALGRVRDADARLAMLSSLETRIPPAAPSLVVLRRHHEHLRTRLMRKLIKGFERLEVPVVLGDVAEGRTRANRPWARAAGGWQEQVRRTVAERAHATSDSIQHTTGVYFPNRLHRTRITVKKCRYAVEIAGETGVGPGVDDVLRYLKNTQDVLGDLRDRQILIDELAAMEAPAPDEIDAGHIRLVIQIVEAECRELHTKYLKRRARLLEICQQLESTYSSRGVSVAPLAAAVAVSSAVYLWRRRALAIEQFAQPAGATPRDREVAVRIPIPGAAAVAR
jgi:CHAD domain-containing protein